MGAAATGSGGRWCNGLHLSDRLKPCCPTRAQPCYTPKKICACLYELLVSWFCCLLSVEELFRLRCESKLVTHKL